jgi:heme-degrading monooxygenase HmoA
MHARVSTYRGSDADTTLDGFKGVARELEQVDGFSHAYFMVDRASGKALSITLWETEDALNASVAIANDMRTRAAGASNATIETVEHYEVPLTIGAPTKA